MLVNQCFHAVKWTNPTIRSTPVIIPTFQPTPYYCMIRLVLLKKRSDCWLDQAIQPTVDHLLSTFRFSHPCCQRKIIVSIPCLDHASAPSIGMGAKSTCTHAHHMSQNTLPCFTRSKIFSRFSADISSGRCCDNRSRACNKIGYAAFAPSSASSAVNGNSCNFFGATWAGPWRKCWFLGCQSASRSGQMLQQPRGNVARAASICEHLNSGTLLGHSTLNCSAQIGSLSEWLLIPMTWPSKTEQCQDTLRNTA